MSFRDYLHEKAEESRHNETLAYLMFVAGAIFFVGGILEMLSLGEVPSWFLFLPYIAQTTAGVFLGLTLMIGGVSLIVLGIAAGISYANDRGWYMKELGKANSLDAAMMDKKSGKNGSKKKKRNA
jgi:uncharacterized membrane protein YiaA